MIARNSYDLIMLTFNKIKFTMRLKANILTVRPKNKIYLTFNKEGTANNSRV